MTPEERAEKLVEELDQIFYGERLRVITDALRDTHNAAIDQAAELAFGYAKEKVLRLKHG